MKKYRRIVIEATGSTDVLKTVAEALPEPKPGEVRVRVLAAGVGFADVMAQHGGYPLAPEITFYTRLRFCWNRGSNRGKV